MSEHHATSPDAFQHIAKQIEEAGYCILDAALPKEVSTRLYQHVTNLKPDEFSRAGMGRNNALHLDHNYRRDKIHWLDANHPAETGYLSWMEQLRLHMNRHLFMGLFDYECHFAHYTAGAFYKRHLDAFKNDHHHNKNKRVLTTLFYLNPEWNHQDGGELLIYEHEKSQPAFQHVSPSMGKLVVFLSNQFPHEVLAANRDRYSIAGWFRVKT